MEIEITARHMKLTDALAAHVREKLEAPVAEIIRDPAARMQVEITSGPEHGEGSARCHVQLFVPKQKPINVTEENPDAYRAIDAAHHRLMEAVRRQHDRMVG